MAFDPYKILGVDKTATQADIRQAYRRLAQQNHPDKHGGREEAVNLFQQIKAAYEAIGTTERRQHYDTTGSTSKPDNITAKARGVLIHLFQKCLERMVADQYANLVTLMKDEIKKLKADKTRMLAANKKNKKLLKDLESRVEYSGEGDNLFHAVIIDQIEKMRQQDEETGLQLKVTERAFELLGEYTGVDKHGKPTVLISGSTSGYGGWGGIDMGTGA